MPDFSPAPAFRATHEVPRRWSESVDGIVWLPRMIDKARMKLNGRLGLYLLGHSPVDAGLMKRLKVRTAEFVDIVARNGDDASVLAQLRARGFDEARVRRWSQRFTRTWRLFIPMWDLDEGHVKPNQLGWVLLGAIRVFGPAIVALRVLRREP